MRQPIDPDVIPKDLPLPLPHIAPPALPSLVPSIDVTGLIRDALQGLMHDILLEGHSDVGRLIDTYMLHTSNFAGHGAITQNATLQEMYGTTKGIALALLAVVLTYTCMRSILERSFRPRYTLKIMLPKVMLVVALTQVGLPLIQAAVDLNNSVVSEVWSYTPPVEACNDTAIWCAIMQTQASNGLLLNSVLLMVAILLIVLALVGVCRSVLIVVLGIVAPLAFLAMLLPETRYYTTMWRRLFVTTIFSQALQVLVLRLALTLTLRGGFVSALHGLVAMYLVLKVPSALNAASHAESKLISTAKHLEHSAQTALHHAMSPAHSRVRSHPAA